jgi:serine/threonine-protein kinase RsbW
MKHDRIFGHISRDEFIGRHAELRQVVNYATQTADRKLLVSAAPNGGGSEFLRQAYDELFFRRPDAVPFHFSFGKNRDTPAEVGASFFRSFLQQYVAYRRVDPSLCIKPVSLRDVLELALPTDYEGVSALLEAFDYERASSDPVAFLRFCLGAPQRLAGLCKRRILPLIDCLALAGEQSDSKLTASVATAFAGRGEAAIVAGLRRQMPGLRHAADADFDVAETIDLDYLNNDDAPTLLDSLTRRLKVESDETTRDLVVQQLGGSPFLLAALAQSASQKGLPLTSFVNCQLLYVDELLGGRMYRHFSNLLSQIAPQAQTRRTLLRVLYESRLTETRKASVWTWKKRLGVEGADFERMIDTLHVHELANSSGVTIELNTEAVVWVDYLAAQYQMEVAGEARALTVANARVNSLKRAPKMMTRKYRRATALGLKDLLARFNCQQVPAPLFDYQKFAAAHLGVGTEAVNAALNAEVDLVSLPQVVSAVDCSAMTTSEPTEEGRCAVGYGFDDGDYRDEQEIVWIAAEIDSKLEAAPELTSEWCDRLERIAREAKFHRVQLWLVSPEGFSSEAEAILKKHRAYGSSRRQVELLAARLKTSTRDEPATDEYEMVIPMGTDTELIAAHTVEQIARRIKFGPDAINQIKLALVEACINATEHSLSPDRKIYQRFRIEDDKLIVTVASRGVVPASVSGQNGLSEPGKSRRGWGLKLIKTLMDEVEFERVDDGTQLRMTKYLRS